MSNESIEAEEISQSVAVIEKPGALAATTASPATTAAQAKVEAIASLTMKAYDRAATLQITAEEAKALAADFPDDAFQPGAAGKENLIYIEHAHLRDRLSQVFGMGQWAIIPRSRWAEDFTTFKGTPGSRVYVEAMLVIRGCFVSEAIGAMEYYPKNESQNYGDAVEGAKTAAFRRLAKELGVGLQAWKKDWCLGWWQRRNPSGRPVAPAAARPAPTAPPARPAAPEAKPAAKAETPEEKLARFVAQCRVASAGKDQIITDLLSEMGWLMEGETINDIGITRIPKTKAEADSIIAEIRARSGAADEVPGAEAPAARTPKDDESWREVIVPIPRKGMTRDVYLKNPDTIGSLYDARHGDDEEAQIARSRLWGFVTNYEPKGWVKRDGTQMPANDADHAFRASLDQFADWFAKNHPGEKL